MGAGVPDPTTESLVGAGVAETMMDSLVEEGVLEDVNDVVSVVEAGNSVAVTEVDADSVLMIVSEVLVGAAVVLV